MKSKGQVALSQKGKVATLRQIRMTDPEGQEQGKMRAAGAVELDKEEQEVGDSEKGRSYLEERMLLIPHGAPLTLGALATTLFQMAALLGMGLPVINAVCTVAFLLKDVKLGAVAEDIREIANSQFNEMTSDLKEFTDRLKEKVMEELVKKMAVLEKKTAELAEVAKKSGNIGSTPYRDALTRAVSGTPMDTNPRLAAKESVRQRQSLIDLPKESNLRDCTNLVLVGKFSEAMGKATAQKHKIRLVLKLQNGGILVEMATDEGVAWLASKTNAEAFLWELGETKASFKMRLFKVITYYVSLNLDTNNKKDRKEIKETNSIPEGVLTKIRWIKPPTQRRLDQHLAHAIITFSDADTANRTIINGLSICHKRVSVVKCRKEPIRCLKCQGWDHVASECVISKEVNICRTCGVRDHWTSKCNQQEVTYCMSCRAHDHTIWDRGCPTFLRKIDELNARDLANDIPFFPAKENWTWSQSYPLQGPLQSPIFGYL